MNNILSSIDQPDDLKRLDDSQLEQLASEIREELITSVTKTGGHLASNLGVVELTLALHRAFESPKDKLVWDVGHQSYVHKLLTGRRVKFGTLRQHGGLSGFTDRAESPHDVFGAGHASTSVSAAIGMALARDLKGEDHNVVAVLGDGALTGGMAFEGLNHAGHLGLRLIVVLNDNGMSISPTIGGVAEAFNRLRLSQRFIRAKAGVRHAAARAPLGDLALGLGSKVMDKMKRLIVPSMWWEELGFIYIGPIDGHDIKAVEEALQQAKLSSHKPVLVHAITIKGKGYNPAERDAIGFHGIPPQRDNGHALTTYSAIFSKTICNLLARDERIFVVTAAMGEGNHLRDAARDFPKRVIDVGICEQHAVTMAAGLAVQGIVPVVAIYSTFMQRAFDQLLHDVCLQDLHVIFALDRAGIVGDDGKTHQGTFDLSYLSLMPNMIVCAPKDENEMQHMLYTATLAGHPIAIRYPRGCSPGVNLDLEMRELPVGKAERLRDGDDIALVAIGSTVTPALEAAQELSYCGVEATVINARFAKPLDLETISEAAERTGRLLVVEENVAAGGLGSLVVQAVQHARIHCAVECICVPDEFVPHGPQEALRKQYSLDGEGIALRALRGFSGMSRKEFSSLRNRVQ
ncbi:MAG: 1-deoxy-D-xylulose-5-phosphate synthase [Chloroflexi bacterium]|nr:1-deoxy-D-xylulose-5-phosphate synthase [Chloroflexota bacterium]